MAQTSWIERARTLGQAFAERAAKHDADESFVADNYTDLKENRFFSLAVPEVLGGGDAGFDETCHVLRELGRHCPSTALALSMHTHVVAANVWNFMNGKPGADGVLKKVADKQLVLVSTGATDWIDSNGSARRVPGGYRVSARKVFASGCPVVGAWPPPDRTSRRPCRRIPRRRRSRTLPAVFPRHEPGCRRS